MPEGWATTDERPRLPRTTTPAYPRHMISKWKALAGRKASEKGWKFELAATLCAASVIGCASPSVPVAPSEAEPKPVEPLPPAPEIWSAEEASAEVLLGKLEVEVQGQKEALRDVERPYKIGLVEEKLPQDVDLPFHLAVHPDALGVHIVSVLQTAAWYGRQSAQIVPHETTLHMGGRESSKEVGQAEAWELWSGVPLHLNLLPQQLEIWRAYAEWEGDEALKPETVVAMESGQTVLEKLEEFCPDLAPKESSSKNSRGKTTTLSSSDQQSRCNPFLLTIDPKARGKELKLLLSAFDELEKNTQSPIHALVLLHGKEEVQAIARNIQNRGRVGQGKLSAGRVQETIQAHADEFRKCHNEGLTRHVQLTGAIVLRFTIEDSGKTSGAVALPESEITDQTVQSCALSTLSGLNFPAPEGGRVTVTYPLRFKY